MREIRPWEIAFCATLAAGALAQLICFVLQIVVEFGVNLSWASLWGSRNGRGGGSNPPSLVGDKNAAEKYIAHAANRGRDGGGGGGHHHVGGGAQHHQHHGLLHRRDSNAAARAAAASAAAAARISPVLAQAVAAAATFPLQPGAVPHVPHAGTAAPQVPVWTNGVAGGGGGGGKVKADSPTDPLSPQNGRSGNANPRDAFQRQASMPNAHASVISVVAPSGVGEPTRLVSQQNLIVSGAPVASLATPAPATYRHGGSGGGGGAGDAAAETTSPLAAAVQSASPRGTRAAYFSPPPLSDPAFSQAAVGPAAPSPAAAASYSTTAGGFGASQVGGAAPGASQVAVSITPSNRAALMAQARRQASQQRLLMLATVAPTGGGTAASQQQSQVERGLSSSNLLASQIGGGSGDGVSMTAMPPLHVIPEKRDRHARAANNSGRTGGDASSGDERDDRHRRQQHSLMPGTVNGGHKSDGDNTDGDASDGAEQPNNNTRDRNDSNGTAGLLPPPHPQPLAALTIPSPAHGTGNGNGNGGNVSATAPGASAFGYPSPSPKAAPSPLHAHSGHSPLLGGGGGGNGGSVLLSVNTPMGATIVQPAVGAAGTTALPTPAHTPSPDDSRAGVARSGASGAASPTAALSPPLFVRPRLGGVNNGSPKAGTHAAATLQVAIASPTPSHHHLHPTRALVPSPHQLAQAQAQAAAAHQADVKVREPVKVKVDRYSLPWWFHRLGVVLGCLQLLGYLDPNSSFDILPRVLAYVITSLVIATMMMSGSIWVWFAVSLLYKDAHQTAPRSLLYALVGIPIFYVICIDVLSIPALYSTYQYVWDIPNAVGYMLTVCSYGVILPVTYYRVRATLMRFVESVTKAGRAGPPSGSGGGNSKPSSPNATTANGSAAAASGALSSPPASGARETVVAVDAQQQQQQASGGPHARPMFDLSHIHRGLANLSRFVVVLLFLDFFAVVSTTYMAIDHILTAINDPTRPPPEDDTELSIGNCVIMALVQGATWAILWYSWNPINGRSTHVTAMRVQTVTRPLPPASPLELTHSKPQPPSPFTDA